MATPIRKYVVNSAKAVLRKPADAILQSASLLTHHIDSRVSSSRAILDNPALSAKFYPRFPQEHAFAAYAREEEKLVVIDGLPVPPRSLMEGYGNGEAESYVQTSRNDAGKMKSIAREAGVRFDGIKVLDFGCAAGRLIRQFAEEAKSCEIRGVDISAAHIAWCQRHLSPPFRFTTTTTLPHLPFEDRYFDFIYAGSVFTHISDLADNWLMELKRILKPGGKLYATVHDGHCIEVLEKRHPDHLLTPLLRNFDQQSGFRSKEWDMVSVARNPKDAMVFYDERFLRELWGREFKVVSYNYEAYGYQTAVLLER